MPDPDTEIKQQLPLVSIGEIYRVKTEHEFGLKPIKVGLLPYSTIEFNAVKRVK